MNKKKIKVLMLAAEITPIAKVGGLGDVVGALPKALARLNVDIRLCLPFYGSIDTKKYPVKKIANNIYQTFLPGTKIPLYLLKHKYFESDNIYFGLGAMKNSKYVDNVGDIERFIYYSEAALRSARKINFKPDVIHLNDWHTAIVPSLLGLPENKKFFKKTKTIYTIHNLANQGITTKTNLRFINYYFPSIIKDLEDGNINLMAQGIIGADIVTTVSPTYAREILTSKHGAGLTRVLKLRQKSLCGILNGIDTDFFNPANDRFIQKRYSARSINKKVKNKTALQKTLGLKVGADTPLVGFVSRFVWQKGLDLITKKLGDLNCQFVFLGTGDRKYEKQLEWLAKTFPQKMAVIIKFDESLAHQIYAASDFFLVPSRFEPCGLTQMIAMHYGSIPIVRETGGLADTVDSDVGFSFKGFNSFILYKTIKIALRAYKNKEYRRLQLAGMKKNFSWDVSAKKYLKIYKETSK